MTASHCPRPRHAEPVTSPSRKSRRPDNRRRVPRPLFRSPRCDTALRTAPTPDGCPEDCTPPCRSRTPVSLPEVDGRHGVGQPHAVLGAVELVPVAEHPPGLDHQDDRLAAALAHARCRLDVGRQVDVMPLALDRDPSRRIASRNRGTVPWYSSSGGSTGTSPKSIGSEWPWLARIRVPSAENANRCLSFVRTTASSWSRGDRSAVLGTGRQQLFDGHPPFGVQFDPDDLWAMAKHQAQEFAGGNQLLRC